MSNAYKLVLLFEKCPAGSLSSPGGFIVAGWGDKPCWAMLEFSTCVGHGQWFASVPEHVQEHNSESVGERLHALEKTLEGMIKHLGLEVSEDFYVCGR